MVLIDTSVWLRFLRDHAPYGQGLEDLLTTKQVAGHDLVYGELLMGDKGGHRKLLLEYAQMPQAKVVAHHEVVAFVRDRHLHGRGVGWVDIHLVAAAIANEMQFWTADERLAQIARECGVAYQIRG